jgi:hypothetical protein
VSAFTFFFDVASLGCCLLYFFTRGFVRTCTSFLRTLHFL